MEHEFRKKPLGGAMQAVDEIGVPGQACNYCGFFSNGKRESMNKSV